MSDGVERPIIKRPDSYKQKENLVYKRKINERTSGQSRTPPPTVWVTFLEIRTLSE
jgi:hypothetical protein